MSPLFWLDVVAYVLSTVGAAALALMVLGAGQRRALNRFFALFALAEAAWALSSILLRVTMWLAVGSPGFWLELATVAFALMGPFLLLFTVRYVGRPTRVTDLSAAAGLLVTVVLSIFVFRHELLFNPQFIANDMPKYDISPWGFLAAFLPALYIVWSLVLFWLERRRTGASHLAVGVLVLLAGFVVGGLLNPPFPVMSLTTSFSIAVLGYGIVSRQLLNPLRELTTELERKVQQRTQELEQRVASEQQQRERLQQANEQIEKSIAAERAQREQLQQLIGQIQSAAEDLNATATEIVAAITQQASGAAQQSAAISQASSTIDEVRAISEQTSDRAQGVAGLVQRTNETSRAGQEAANQAIRGMQEVRQKVQAIASDITALSEQTRAIGQIIATVSDIAAQSNILALNAAVEAARAGEAGRGFAVVANEVRSLAEQSQTATVQVKEILGQIQRGVNRAVTATGEGMKGVDEGASLTAAAEETIRRLAESAAAAAEAAAQIAAAAGQQLVGMEQVALAMGNINQVAQQNLSGVRQVEQAAAQLNGLSRQLREMVEPYRA